MKKFKVIYHVGYTLDSSTKVKSGFVIALNDELKLVAKDNTTILDLENAEHTELFYFGLATMLKIRANDITLFSAVVRLCIAGEFIIANAFGTRKLKNLIDSFPLTGWAKW